MNNSDHTIKSTNTDYAPFYEGYVKRVRMGNIHEIFGQDQACRHNLFSMLRVSENLDGYAPGKWSVKELVQHCIDTERIFSVRGLMIARSESKEIPGYDHDHYVANSNADSRDLKTLETEWNSVRQSTVSLFESFQKDDFEKTGIVNGNNLSIAAIPYIIVGHGLHHFQVLREKYGFEF